MTPVNMPRTTPSIPGTRTNSATTEPLRITPAFSRWRLVMIGNSNTIPSAIPIQAERDDDRKIVTAISTAGAQRPNHPRVACPGSNRPRPLTTASGSTIDSRAPNSMGWMAVPDGRVNRSRKKAAWMGLLAVSPGIEIRSTHACPVRNWIRPRNATSDTTRTTRLSSTTSRTRLLGPSWASERTPSQPANVTSPNRAELSSSELIGRISAGTREAE